MINVLINGCSGRMGNEVLKQIAENPDISVIAGFDSKGSPNDNFPVFNDINKITVMPDVIIDFSLPLASLNILSFAKEKNIPIVIATTGFSDEQIEIIQEYSKHLPIFMSANMSLEINLMAKIVSELAQKLEDSDIEIVETHHNQKKDSPSGTALLLADSINKGLNNKKVYEYNRHDKKEKRNPNEIGIHSIRGGSIVGKHSVLFLGNNESFEITHTVESRSIFASGAIQAARFIIKQQNGLYNMENLLNN